MKKLLTTILSTLFICSSCAVLGKVDYSVSGAIDLNKYLESRYEIASFDHLFERGISHCKAQYSLRADGKIDVLNTGIKAGKSTDAKGKAKLTDIPRVLRVYFFGSFYGDHCIIALS